MSLLPRVGHDFDRYWFYGGCRDAIIVNSLDRRANARPDEECSQIHRSVSYLYGFMYDGKVIVEHLFRCID